MVLIRFLAEGHNAELARPSHERDRAEDVVQPAFVETACEYPTGLHGALSERRASAAFPSPTFDEPSRFVTDEVNNGIDVAVV